MTVIGKIDKQNFHGAPLSLVHICIIDRIFGKSKGDTGWKKLGCFFTKQIRYGTISDIISKIAIL
jgi:hypothetical protein